MSVPDFLSLAAPHRGNGTFRNRVFLRLVKLNVEVRESSGTCYAVQCHSLPACPQKHTSRSHPSAWAPKQNENRNDTTNSE